MNNIAPKSKQEFDKRGNRRKKMVISFRVTPDEREELYRKINLSGRTMQDYLLHSAMNSEVIVMGNRSFQERIIDRLDDIIPVLYEIKEGSYNDITMKELKSIFEIIDKWK